jgi:hypothetical protein
MPIRWNAAKVSDGTDEIEKLLNEIEPLLKQMETKAQETSKLPNVPQYISGYLYSLAYDTRGQVDRYRRRIEAIRKHIPKGALEKDRSRPSMFE